MNRLSPAGEETEQAIPLHSQEEYDAIPEHWNFRCFGALFRLTEKSWYPASGHGTAKFQVW